MAELPDRVAGGVLDHRITLNPGAGFDPKADAAI
jgi:hypothetical protein